MAHSHAHDLELHAIFDGELPAARMAEVLPELLEDPRNVELLVALEQQRRDLLALREALDEGWAQRPLSAEEIELGQLVQRERQLGVALAALAAAALLLCIGLGPQRVLH